MPPLRQRFIETFARREIPYYCIVILYHVLEQTDQIMKRLLWFAAVAAVCVSCGGKKSGYVIDGKMAEGRTDREGKYVYLIPYG